MHQSLLTTGMFIVQWDILDSLVAKDCYSGKNPKQNTRWQRQFLGTKLSSTQVCFKTVAERVKEVQWTAFTDNKTKTINRTNAQKNSPWTWTRSNACWYDIDTARHDLTLRRPLLPYGYNYKASCARQPSFVIFDIRAVWRSALSVRLLGC